MRCLSSSIQERKEEMKRNIKNAKLFTFNRNRESQMIGRKQHEAIEASIRTAS